MNRERLKTLLWLRSQWLRLLCKLNLYHKPKPNLKLVAKQNLKKLNGKLTKIPSKSV